MADVPQDGAEDARSRWRGSCSRTFATLVVASSWHYRPAQIRGIRGVFAAEAKRADVIIEVSGRPSGALAWGGIGYQRVLSFDLGGLKKYAGKALKVAKRVVGGALEARATGQDDQLRAAGDAGRAGSAIKGDEVQDISSTPRSRAQGVPPAADALSAPSGE